MGLEYAPRGAFHEFHNRSQRWAVLCTHRRAGKTVALVNDLIVGALECQLHRPQLAYVGPTYRQTKRIAWQYLKDYGEKYFSKAPSESELKVTLVGDRTIFCLGADNPDSLRGMYLDASVMDEYALFKPSVYSTIIRPALSDRNGWGVFASTPRGKNLFHREYKKATLDQAKYYSLLLRASGSGIISSDELTDLRADMDPEEFAQEYECSFDSALKGAIYADEINQVFYDGRVRPGLYDSALPTHAAYDLGITDATVGVFWQEDLEGWIRVVGVDATTGRSIDYHIEKLNEFQGELGTIWLPHDARAKSLQTGRSLIEQFLEAELHVRVVPNHKIRDRIQATRKLFSRVMFEDEVTEDLVEGLKGYHREWDDNKLCFTDQPYHDWCSDYADAFGYMCVVAGKKALTRLQAAPDDERAEQGYSLDDLYADHERFRPSRLRIQ